MCEKNFRSLQLEFQVLSSTKKWKIAVHFCSFNSSCERVIALDEYFDNLSFSHIQFIHLSFSKLNTIVVSHLRINYIVRKFSEPFKKKFSRLPNNFRFFYQILKMWIFSSWGILLLFKMNITPLKVFNT